MIGLDADENKCHHSLTVTKSPHSKSVAGFMLQKVTLHRLLHVKPQALNATECQPVQDVFMYFDKYFPCE